MLRKFLPCLKGYWVKVILTPITVIGESIFEIIIPFLMAFLIDRGINGVENGFFATNEEAGAYVLKIGGIMVLLALSSMILGVVCGRLASVASTGFAYNIRKKIYGNMQQFSFANVDKFSTASLVTRLTTDVTYAQMSLMICTRMLARAPAMMICSIVMAAKINADLARIFIFAVPVLGIAIAFLSSKAFPRFRKMFAKYDAMNASVQENLISVRIVKSFVREKYESDRFIASSDDVMQSQKKAEKMLIVMMPLMQFTMYACMIAVSWFGGRYIVGGEMTSGQLMSFISYISQILMSLSMIAMGFVSLVMSRASFERMAEVMDEKSDINDSDADPALTVADGSVEFRDVSFSYAKSNDNLTLKDINLKIKSGETVGIIGGTGSAKTSLAQLIPRFYDIQSGELLVGGKPVTSYTLCHLRDSVAMVLQKNLLFSGTIRDNLRWGDENATDDEITAAAKLAQAHDFIESFPDGYDTELGQGGVNVSGGQKQRLCIARALLKKPKILIFDDSTSAVDTATDSKIRHALADNLGDVTSIIIAQRITSVMDADKIIVLDDGEISGVGTHDELLKNNEIYREVWNSQQKGVEK